MNDFVPQWGAGPICIDELVTVQGQYLENHRWNGWLIPHIDPWSVERVMQAFFDDHEATPYDQPAPTHEWVTDLHSGQVNLILTEWDGDDGHSETLYPDEDGLYPLGAYSWVWSKDEEAGQ